MANYDQSGNPVGSGRTIGGDRNNPSQPGGQQGGYASGQAGGRSGYGGQQSQFSGGQSQGQGQGQNRAMQQSNRGMGYGGLPDLYSGFAGGPFALISRLSDEMDRIFESFGMGSVPARGGYGQRGVAGQGAQGQGGLRSLWAPHIELAERDGKLLIQADLPGVRKEDVNVQIEEDAVIIQGQRREEHERNEQGFYHTERSYGSFHRVIPLPEGVNAEQANATFRDGVLRIELPAPQPKPRGRRLEIRDEAGQQGPGSHSAGVGQGTTGQFSAAQGQQGATSPAASQQGSGSAGASGAQHGSTERR